MPLLAGLVETKGFREDLYFRLCQLQVRVPELARRLEDIPALVEHCLHLLEPQLLRKPPTFSESAVRALQARRWRGNVRELFAEVGRTVVACVAAGVDVAEAHHVAGGQTFALPVVASAAASPETLAPRGIKVALRECELRIVEEALARAGGKVRGAAKLLGEPLSTLHSRMKRLDLV